MSWGASGSRYYVLKLTLNSNVIEDNNEVLLSHKCRVRNLIFNEAQSTLIVYKFKQIKRSIENTSRMNYYLIV